MIGNLILFAFTAIALGFFTSLIFRGLKTRTYQNTQGRVVSTEIKSELGKRRVQYSPQITYEYTVESRQYRNDAYRVGFFSHNKEKIEEILQLHPLGSNVDVFF